MIGLTNPLRDTDTTMKKLNISNSIASETLREKLVMQ